MNSTYRSIYIVPAALAALALAVAAPVGWADDDSDSDSDDVAIDYDEHEIFFELNNTDGDLGIHALIDGDAWKKLTIEDPLGRKLLNIGLRGRLRRQGLTEIFFESAEPVFDDLDPEDFFLRFPAGDYEIQGRTLDGEKLESETELTHLMPAPAGGIVVSGTAIKPELVDCVEGPIPKPTTPVTISAPVTISWDEVDRSHLALGSPNDSMEIEIHNYQVVVEVETKEGDELELSVTLPHGTRSLAVPFEFTDLDCDGQIKFEILAREKSFNQTAVESCFVLDGKNCPD